MPLVVCNTTPLVALSVFERLSVLLLAEEVELITALRLEIERLLHAGLHLGQDLIVSVVRQAGEV